MKEKKGGARREETMVRCRQMGDRRGERGLREGGEEKE